MDAGVAGVYSDFAGLSSLRQQAKINPDDASHEVAQQFESIFIGMMMKAMREATPKDSMFNSDQMESYQEMFDNQLALDLSAKGGLGLGRIIEEQISRSSMLKQL